jgi:uridine kinase
MVSPGATRRLRRYSEFAAELLILRPSAGSTVLIALDGLGGTGKTLFAEALSRACNSVAVVHFDHFFVPSSEMPLEGWPTGVTAPSSKWRRLVEEVIDPLRRGEVAHYEVFDSRADSYAGFCDVQPGGIVIVEGVYALRCELAPLYDYRIWAECHPSERLRRGVARDGESTRGSWENDWIPVEQSYRATEAPYLKADLIVDCSSEVVHDPMETFIELQSGVLY